MANLETLEKSLNKLENYTVKYIYKKYIEIDSTPEPTTTESTTAVTQEVSTAPIFKYSKKPNSEVEYKLYLDRIFGKEREHIITQHDSLSKDLENMQIADEDYETNPEKFKRQNHNSYPDIKRCSYIRKHKHKLMRCKNNIMNDDEDMCSKHEDALNIYWDMYNELIDKITSEPNAT
jgi:hypothetical protein